MIGDRVGLAALVAAVDDALGDPPQILDQDDAQGDRRSPQFADRERLLLLIGVDEAAPGIDIEAAVGVRDERPDQSEHPRQSRQRDRRRAWAVGDNKRGGRSSRTSRIWRSTRWKLSISHSAAGVIAALSSTASQIER